MHRYLFADEAGCFTFNRNPNVSKYFILCTVTMADRAALLADIFALRRDLVHAGEQVLDYFHATEDNLSVREAFFSMMLRHRFQVQATICEKSKAQPNVRRTKAGFYQYPWFFHLRHGIAKHVPADAALTVTAASIGTKKEKTTFRSVLSSVMSQTVPRAKWAVDFRPCSADPCLQVADYCAWAIQRKWERGDRAAYDLILPRIGYEYDLWQRGTTHYY